MEHVPDAPYIREAEMYGYPADDPVKCPICGRECEEIYLDEDDSVVGCDECIRRKDSWEWAETNRQMEEF